MPYARNSELPNGVRDRYTERCQTVFRRVFNEAIADGRSESDAFAIAHSAGRNCMESTKEAGVGESAKSLMAVKFAEGSDNIIEGLAIPYGGPFGGKDLHGEDFGPDTDFALEWFPEEGRPVIFHHGLDESIKTALVGRQVSRDPLDAGVWAKVQLDKRNRYYAQIKEMVESGELSFSSGSIPHLVKTRKDGHIEQWPWVELSLTPTPANPDAAIYAVKTSDAIEHIAAVKSVVPAAIKSAADLMEDGFTEQTEGGSEPEPLAEQSERVLAGLKAWVERVGERSIHRAKVGRELSKANIETLREAYQIIGGLIERSERPSEDEQREAEARKAFAEYARLEAELLGVKPG